MRKKILQILGGIGFGGAEAFVMNQYRNLKDDFSFDFAIQVRFDRKSSYEEEIIDLGGAIYYTETFRSSPINFYKSIKNIIKEHGPYSAVHIHINEQCGIAAKAAYDAGIRNIICHAHSSQYGQKNKILKTVMLVTNKALVSRFAKHIVGCSNEAVEMYFGKKNNIKATILKNPIDLARFGIEKNPEYMRSLGIEDGDLVITHVGRFIEVKNHIFMLKIYEELKKKDVKFKMLFVGNGVLFDQIKVEAINNGYSDILFLGERKDVNRILGCTDVMILPSHYEGLPTVVLEAQATGIPSIVSDKVNRMSDIGLGLVDFVEINKPEKWANCIIMCGEIKMSDRSAIIERFRKNGIDIVAVSDALSKLYRS